MSLRESITRKEKPCGSSLPEGFVSGSPDETGEGTYRPLLFSIAYGMTGSVGDAEDIVQDAFVGLTRACQAGTVIADQKFTVCGMGVWWQMIEVLCSRGQML